MKIMTEQANTFTLFLLLNNLRGYVMQQNECANVLALKSYYFRAGLMFWFTLKKLFGSYLFLIVTSRS
jgi:hypothetical protein